MHKVTSVRPLSDYRLQVELCDGVSGEVDLAERLFGPVFQPLSDPELFSRVGIDEYGAICWPNGADLAPDALHARLRAQGASAA